MDGKFMTIINKPLAFEPVSNSTFSAAMLEAEDYNKWILNYYSLFIKNNLLEIGLGHGEFYKYLPRKITNYVGVDIDEKLVDHARSLNPQNQYFQADLSSINFSDSHKNTFETVVCLNVLEHIENDTLALKNMIDTLTSSGHILLFVPAFQALYTDLDRLAGHYRRYKISDIKALCQRCDGHIVKWSYFNSIGGFGWWLNKFKKHDSLNDNNINWQIRFFNKVILPISKFFQPLTRKFFGQSLYVVIRRK
jgi:SAM-dependent methyltransferase